MGDDKMDSRLFELVPGPDGKPIAIPVSREEEPDPIPAADGRYYLTETNKAIHLALELADRGIEVYCAKCKSPLKVSRAFLLCTKDERHFSVLRNLGRRDR